MGNDTRKLLDALKDQGYSVRRTKKQVWIITRDGRFVAAMADNPGDYRAIKNAIAALRRGGFVWPRKR